MVYSTFWYHKLTPPNRVAGSKSEQSPNVTYIPNTYITKLEQESRATAASHFAEEKLDGHVKYQMLKDFSNAKYFYGLSLTLTEGTSHSDPPGISGVKNVWPNRLVPPPDALGAAHPSTQSNGTLPNIKGTSGVNRPLKVASVDKLDAKEPRAKMSESPFSTQESIICTRLSVDN